MQLCFNVNQPHPTVQPRSIAVVPHFLQQCQEPIPEPHKRPSGRKLVRSSATALRPGVCAIHAQPFQQSCLLCIPARPFIFVFRGQPSLCLFPFFTAALQPCFFFFFRRPSFWLIRLASPAGSTVTKSCGLCTPCFMLRWAFLLVVPRGLADLSTGGAGTGRRASGRKI